MLLGLFGPSWWPQTQVVRSLAEQKIAAQLPAGGLMRGGPWLLCGSVVEGAGEGIELRESNSVGVWFFTPDRGVSHD